MLKKSVCAVLLLVALISEIKCAETVSCEVRERQEPFDSGFEKVPRKTILCEFKEDVVIAEPLTLSNPVNESVGLLIISRNDKVEYLPQDLPFPNLVVIQAFNSTVKSLNRKNFNGLSKLGKIDLNNNQVATIEPNTFDDLVELSYLYLDNNKLTSLPSNIFDKNVELDTLYLKGNQLTSLDADLFKNNKKIALLHLSENKFKTLPTGIFSGLSKMRQLWMKSNEIENLPSNILDDCESLVDLDFSRNQIKTINPTLLSHLHELREVSFSFNPLDFIDLVIFDDNENLSQFFFNSVATKDIRNIDKVDQMKKIKGISLYNGGCIDDQFHEGNLNDLKELVKTKCTVPVVA